MASVVLVANVFEFLGALNGDAGVVFLDGPPPVLRSENDVGVMQVVVSTTAVNTTVETASNVCTSIVTSEHIDVTIFQVY